MKLYIKEIDALQELLGRQFNKGEEKLLTYLCGARDALRRGGPGVYEGVFGDLSEEFDGKPLEEEGLNWLFQEDRNLPIRWVFFPNLGADENAPAGNWGVMCDFMHKFASIQVIFGIKIHTFDTQTIAYCDRNEL